MDVDTKGGSAIDRFIISLAIYKSTSIFRSGNLSRFESMVVTFVG